MDTRREAGVERALLDVRGAFRLLYVYQEAVLNICEQIREYFGMEFYNWNPYSPLPTRRNPVGSSAWSLLPMRMADLLYLPAGAEPSAPKSGEWMLNISVCSDWENCDPVPPRVADLSAVRDSRSCLGLFGYGISEDLESSWYHGVFSHAYPGEGEQILDVAGGVRVVGDSSYIPLAEFMTASGCQRQAQRFEALLREAKVIK